MAQQPSLPFRPLAVAAALTLLAVATPSWAANVGKAAASETDSVPRPPEAPLKVGPAPSERLGPLEGKLGKGKFRIGGAMQVGYRHSHGFDTARPAADIEYERDKTDDSFSLRRVRFDWRASFLDDLVMVRQQLSFAANEPELLDFFVESGPETLARARLGLSKVPFTHYRDQTFMDLVFVDWPIASRFFGSERQLGLSVRGDLGAFDYALGAFNGDPSRPQNHRYSRVYGEPAPSRSSLKDATAFAVPHPELFARAAYVLGPLRLAGSGAYDANPLHGVDQRARFAGEALVDTALVDFLAIGYVGFSEDLAGKVEQGSSAVLTELTVKPHRRVELGLRYSGVFINSFLRGDTRSTVDGKIAAAGDGAAALTKRYADVGDLKAMHEATAVVALYAVGHDLKLQTDFSYLRDTRVSDDRTGTRLRVQAQLAF